MLSATAIKEAIMNQISVKDRTEQDNKVILRADSFWGCSEESIKGGFAASITEFAGCEAWKIAMEFVYGKQEQQAEIEEEKEPEGMTIGKLHVAGIINDNTVITVRKDLFKVVARGEWFLDGMMKYNNRELESFTWQDDGEFYADLKREEE